jgi:MYXO-CTERM domain-containing protein
MRPRALLRATALALLAAGLSHASLISLTTNGGAVPDNSVVGAAFTMNIVSAETISLAGNGNVILRLSGIVHNWVGDLSFILTHVDTSTSATIFNRPGYPVPNASGSRGDINGTYAFGSGYASSFESAAVTAHAVNSSILPGSYAPEGNLNVFNGQSAGGTWRLFITDQAAGTTVNTTWTWTLDIQTAGSVAPGAVPEPGGWAFAAAGLAALALMRRRRRS